ncbi:MAG: TIGR02217 family protein [Alphaproteobacteria bacterium]|nr:MAG: TIGR02217 family protein [Alphaproteobacteria bacterium]
MSFHEVRFPTDIALRASGGPERKTEVVILGSGHEERNARWADSRRRYDAGYGVKSLSELYQVMTFFEERRGRLYGFRWKDRLDHKSCAPEEAPASADQQIGTGDGAAANFQLIKTYGGGFAPYTRTIHKPVAGSVRVAVNGLEQVEGSDFVVDTTTGTVTFLPGREPAALASITAGFEFDVPVRFDTDALKVDLASFEAGSVQSIPVVEIRP